MHSKNDSWGDGNFWFKKAAINTVKMFRPKTILDYGAGKGSLEKVFPGIKMYDPGVDGIDQSPEPADLVLCCCVLEHIEPECLDDVLNHMRLMTLNRILILVSCFPSGETLADGRNAHLIVQDVDWWLPHLMKRWKINEAAKLPNRRFYFLGRV